MDAENHSPQDASNPVATLVAEANHDSGAGRWEDALARYERALRLAAREGTVADAAEILRRIGMVHRDRRDLELAEELFGASLEVARLNSLDLAVGRALISSATIHSIRGELDEAGRLYLEARVIGRRTAEPRLVALAEQNLGTIHYLRGDLQAALASYAAVLEFHQTVGDDAQASRVLNNMAIARISIGAWDEATRDFDRATEAAERAGQRVMVGHIEINRADLHIKRKDFAAARAATDRAFELFERLGCEQGCAEAHQYAGVVCRERGDHDGAHRHFVEASRLARRCEEVVLEAQILREWARVYLAERRNAEALRRLNESHRLFERMRARRDLLEVERDLDELEETYLVVVRAWGESVESRDRYTAGHCERVGRYACHLARAAGVSGRDLAWLRMGGFLHDVGKTTIPAELLNRPGPLTGEEWELMKRHTIEGDALVAELDFPWDVRPIVRSHHERWDGSGYPDELAGEEIPLAARIVCIADVYDALTSTRSYRAALGRDEALRVMRADAGRAFDPALLDLFEELVRGGMGGDSEAAAA